MKRWTERRWLRLTALLLSVLLFAGTAGMVFDCWQQWGLFGEEMFYSLPQKRQMVYTDHGDFCSEFSSDLDIVVTKTGSYATEALQRKLVDAYRDNSDAFLDTFNQNKANFIRSYLFDSLCQEDIYENYEQYFNVNASVSVPQITIEKRVLVDAYAPEFVQKVQKILNGTDGNGFLRYADLVPQRVLEGAEYSDEITFAWDGQRHGRSFSYTLDLTDPATYYKKIYDDFVAGVEISAVSYQGVLPASLRYYIVDPKNNVTFTNTAYTQKDWLTYFGNCDTRFSVLQGKVSQQGLAMAESRQLLQNRFNEALNVYVVLDTEPVPSDDKYAQYKNDFDRFVATDFRWQIALMVLCFLLSLGLLIFLLVITPARRLWIDRLPVEVHFLLSLLCGGAILFFGIHILGNIGGFYFSYAGFLRSLFGIAFCLLAAAGWAVVCEFCCSFARIVKSGEAGHSFLTLRFGRRLGKTARSAGAKLRELWGYQPGAMRKYVLPLILLWTVVMAVLIYLAVSARSAGAFLLWLVLWMLLTFKLLDYLMQLDKIICCAANRTEYTGEVSRLPVSLQRLVQSQQYTRDELRHAIEKAITDERTKAELITNVSHDLKTPLTAVINYIDLLQRCDIDDPTAREYLQVLEDKSAGLKRLIEDLIEASKVSTGNVSLHKTPISLAELANQALVEESDGMEARGLETVMNLQASPTVLADGGKLYRVFENLLSNARKYSLSGTRVYVTVYEDEEFGYFELKNISKEALSVEATELTERFVRGDRSRSEEGNGLGLSIARDLCRLNDGELILQIDGDLFKATVKLPKC